MRINFGAPGDRKDSSGNVWFSYPRRKAYQETTLDLSLDLHPEFQPGGRFTSVSDDSFGKIESDIPWLYASWGEALKRFTLPLLGADDPPAEYQLSLHFVSSAGPSRAGASADQNESSFDVKVQDQIVRENVTISSDATPATPLVLQVPSIEVKGDLIVELVVREGTPLVCAVEVNRRREVSVQGNSP
jgi:hypothetical protein